MGAISWRENLLRQQQQIRDENRWRQRKLIGSAQQPMLMADDAWLTNFSSNDYLGLAAHPKLSEAASKAQEAWGVGAGASHLICGHSKSHHDLEVALASWLGAERVVLFSSGYMANMALCNALAGKGDLILQDRLNHASLIDGGKLSLADFKRYKHCDVDHAATRCESSNFAQLLLMTDGVFSMDGDVAPLAELKDLADHHQGILCVDDAHGVGVLGDLGRGSLSHYGLEPKDNVIMMGTLGKAFGVYGAFVAGDEVVIEHLIQTGRNYIYTTALPPLIPAAVSAGLDLIRAGWSDLKGRLDRNIQLFNELAGEQGLPLAVSCTPIQPVLIGGERECLLISEKLLEDGFLVGAIRYPTVAKGAARLRVAISAAHTAQQIDALAQALGRAFSSTPDEIRSA